jgi:hypothetical protein
LPMLNHMVLVIATLAISTAVAAAKDAPKREECSIFGAEEIENSIRQAPSCRRAVALFELCEFGASGDVGLGAAVTERCEGDFLSKLNAAQKRSYDREQKRCARKNRNKDGTMYRSFEAFCGAYVARDYSAKFLKAAPAERK